MRHGIGQFGLTQDVCNMFRKRANHLAHALLFT